jgi:hypothetical protein
MKQMRKMGLGGLGGMMGGGDVFGTQARTRIR